MTDTTEPNMKQVWDAVIPRRSGLPRSDAGGVDTAPDGTPYTLVDRPEPPPVPNGWYAIVASSDLGPGQVIPVIAVEHELVVFRGEDGRASVLDAHCPHLGAHLGGGAVSGNTLECPYHGWRFDDAGTCVEIPYSDARIPSKGCVRSYPVREQDGLVLFWFHVAGAAPDYEVPTVAEVDDPAWSDAFVYRGELVAALQEMGENNVDYTHFHYVHGREALNDSTSVFSTDGPFSTVVERFGDDELTFTRHTYGPGVALLRVPGMMTVLTTTTPIDRRHARLLWHFHVPNHLEEAADEIMEGVTGGFGLQADVPIWRDKVFRDRPLLVKGDGPVTEFRRWYSQFYAGR